MSNVPTNLIPTKVTGLPEYFGSSTLGYLPYIIDGRTYKVQFANIAAVGAVPSTREINTGSGLGGGGDLSTDRTLFILPGGVDDSRLSVTGVSAGTYGAADSVPVFTVNAQGRVTGVTDTPIVLSNYVPTSRILTAGVGLSGGGDLSANRTFDVDFSNTTPEPLGPGTPGVSTVAAREDHVHPAVDLSDTTETQGVLPLSRGGTGNSLSPVVGAIAYSGSDRMYLTPTSGDAGQVLVSAGGVSPPFWQTISGAGTVTSVDASGGATGLSFTGGPITAAGTLTLGGTLAIASGGTGASVAGTARTNLGAAASGANTDITSIALTTGTISATPTNGTDIVNKLYADSIAAGINFHQSVRLATAAALPANTYNNGTSGVGATLTGNANGALTVDGVAAVVGNRILVKNEVTQANNGVYTVTQVGNGSTPYILTRATDFDTSGSGVNKIDAGDFFLVTAGSTQTNTSWVQQTPLPIVVGTTALVFTQFAAPVLYSAGTGLTLAGTVFSITNTGVSASTYGSASSVPVLAINAQGQVTSASSSSIAIAASQITSGALAIANGGTGSTTAANALTALGAYPASNPNGYTSNTGTVTSVGGTGTVSGLTLSGTVTTSGNLTLGGTLAVTASNFSSQTANTFLSAPNGVAGVPTFRAIVAADIPTLNQNTTGTASNVTGTVAIANGGTGSTTAAAALTALGAYPASNPAGYITSSALTPYALLSGATFTGQVTVPDQLAYDYTTSNLPATAPALNLNFVQSGVVDPRITFTRSTTATFTGSNGLIQTAAINAPRLDYDPVTLAAKGLLIEEARTNLLTYSQEIGGTNWLPDDATVNLNSIAAPNGTLTASTFTDTATNSDHRVISSGTNPSFTVGTSYTLSVYVKNNTRNFVQLVFGTAAFSATAYANFDVATGILGTVGSGTTASITAVGSGWYRCTITAAATVTASSPIFFGLITSATAVRAELYAGTGSSLYVWGAQLEAGAFATSYIPTVASQVTRSADVATMTGTNFSSWYNQSEGTFVTDFTPDEGLTNNVTRVLTVSQGGVTARVVDLYTNGTNWVNYNGTTATAFGTATVTNATQKIAVGYKTADYAYVQNAGTVAAVASALVNAPTQMAIGNTGGTSQLNGHIRQIAYYNTRLPNAVLQGITS